MSARYELLPVSVELWLQIDVAQLGRDCKWSDMTYHAGGFVIETVTESVHQANAISKESRAAYMVQMLVEHVDSS